MSIFRAVFFLTVILTVVTFVAQKCAPSFHNWADGVAAQEQQKFDQRTR